ncbi:LOW QUALITY PROTEIN: Friend virus susceptibility protein 1-like [Myotis lucifugus]|uniref:LOW QUALITY PROTEIN: Friend virus susceptibility protein 1-like n=1 Tax=Myotis lucifugus TaxID=59463 RepID=UPI000CCC71E2|nr:LOW QUALITY PROTEIN: Friend virus susceptibility protein 1-like [Myotis lucifugus]
MGGGSSRVARSTKWNASVSPTLFIEEVGVRCLFKLRGHPPPPHLGGSSRSQQPPHPSCCDHGREHDGAGAPLLAIAQHFKQKPNEHMIAWILQVYDQGSLALALNSQELALLGDLTSNTIFNCLYKGLRGSHKALLTWPLQAWLQRWQSFLHFEVTEMPFRSWTTMEQCIQLARQLSMLEWIYREPASEQAPWPTPEDMPFTQGLRGRLLALARSSEMQLSLVSLPVKGMTVLEVMMEVQGRHQLRDLLSWLLSRDVFKERVDKQSTKVLLDLYVKEATRSRSLPAYMLEEEQPPPPRYSIRACG